MRSRFFLLVVLLVVCFVGCTEKKEETSITKDYPLIKRILYKLPWDCSFVYELGYSGKDLSLVNYQEYKDKQLLNDFQWRYKYDTSKIIIEGTLWGDCTSVDTLLIDNSICKKELSHMADSANGDSYEHIDFIYSAKGEMISAVSEYVQSSFFWKNGNIDYFYDYGAKIQFSYYDELNPFYDQPIDVFMCLLQPYRFDWGFYTTCMNIFGVRNKNLVKTISIPWINTPIEINYIYNGDGYIEEVSAKVPEGKITATLEY